MNSSSSERIVSEERTLVERTSHFTIFVFLLFIFRQLELRYFRTHARQPSALCNIQSIGSNSGCSNLASNPYSMRLLYKQQALEIVSNTPHGTYGAILEAPLASQISGFSWSKLYKQSNWMPHVSSRLSLFNSSIALNYACLGVWVDSNRRPRPTSFKRISIHNSL
jgi:hypothetical protein